MSQIQENYWLSYHLTDTFWQEHHEHIRINWTTYIKIEWFFLKGLDKYGPKGKYNCIKYFGLIFNWSSENFWRKKWQIVKIDKIAWFLLVIEGFLLSRISLVTKQLLGNVFQTFQNGWILVEMLGFIGCLSTYFGNISISPKKEFSRNLKVFLKKCNLTLMWAHLPSHY